MEDIMEYLLLGCDAEYPRQEDIPKMSNKDLEYQVGCWEVSIHRHDYEIKDNEIISI